MGDAERVASILVVDDDEPFARAMRSTLVRAGYRVPEVVTKATRFARALNTAQPDLVLLDIDLSDANTGFDLAALVPTHIPLLFVSGRTDKETLGLAGSRRPAGFVTKPFEPEQLVAAIEMALAASRRATTDEHRASLSGIPEVALLSIREREVLEQLVGHQRAPTIARSLHISHHTVRNHLKNIFVKFNVRSQQELLDRVSELVARR